MWLASCQNRGARTEWFVCAISLSCTEIFLKENERWVKGSMQVWQFGMADQFSPATRGTSRRMKPGGPARVSTGLLTSRHGR